MKCLFSDIDGTLIQGGTIKEGVLRNIYRWTTIGNKFVIATGRPASTITHLRNATNFNYAICCNGGMIVDRDLNVIKSYLVKREDVCNVIDYINEEYTIFISNGIEIKRVITRDDVDMEDIIFISVKHSDENKINELYEQLNGKDLNVSLVINKHYLDIGEKSISKGNGIAFLKEVMDMDDKDIYVVGDQKNDISMFSMFENSYGIKAGDKSLLELSKYQVDDVAEVIDSVIEGEEW